ncbi:c-type cytochrome [Haematobacter sp.]|uniref:c-type cytochrome n=1 Tax=Haematobacter sp. TaxID=2953762 RepID=UPI0028A762A4|nr:c-type cytochrome [Haematobacter sp.]
MSAAYAGGAELALACTSCHGNEGRGGGEIPPLAGRPEAELLAAMEAFRNPGTTATIMPRLLRAYDDAEVADLARYFARVKP